MQPIVTPREMAGLDRFAMETLAIPGLLLMENAGRGIADAAARMIAPSGNRLVHIFCGPGNNGGDGYVVARHLINWGYEVELFILADRDKIKGDGLVNLQILQKLDQKLHFGLPQPAGLKKPGLIIDALLGTGAKTPVTGAFAQAVELINRLDAPVLAIDIPTGVNGETGVVEGPAVKADVTCTMALLKSGLLWPPAREWCGEIQVVDISLPPQALQALPANEWLVEAADAAARLPLRRRDAYKNQVGSAVVVAGSLGFCGAAALSAAACLRSGAGLCYLAFPASLNTVMATKLTEVVLWPMPDRDQGFLNEEGLNTLLNRINHQNACAIGPGLGQEASTCQLVYGLLEQLTLPLVLDADGLNICSRNTEALKNCRADRILTPHPGELARLLNISTAEIALNRASIARHAARTFNAVVVLKGGPTCIAAPDGRLYINSTGNPGMATAGSGDVLTGLIVSLLAQGLNSLDAALTGVYVHGLAGDSARKQFGEAGLLAGDILNMLANALMTLEGN